MEKPEEALLPVKMIPAPPRRMRGAYERLPVGYWLAVVALLVSLLAMSLAGAKGYFVAPRTQPPANRGATPQRTGASAGALELQSPTMLASPQPGAVLGMFYRGTNFRVPYRIESLKMPFSFRTDFEWVHMPQQDVSARLAGRLLVPRAGKYRFFIDANDGARIWINDKVIFDDWDAAAIHHDAGEFELPGGVVPFYVEWYNKEGNGWLGIHWEGPGLARQFIPPTHLIPDPGVGRP